MTWSRPTEMSYGVEHWHLVLEVVGGSVVLACRGRFATTHPHESCERPPIADRCEHCQIEHVSLGLDELAARADASAIASDWENVGDDFRVVLGLRELRDAPATSRPVPTHEDWDLFDIGGESGEA